MQSALGRSKKDRFYAFIETSEGDLAELLVANGMARVHGSAATPANLSSPEREWQKLQRLEREARQQKVGAWGARIGRLSARLARQPPKTGPDSFDAFFHPEKLASRSEAEQILSPAATEVSTESTVVSADHGKPKLDPNTASSEELLAIPGLGPVLASRIIAARPLKSADDLRKVAGIGPKRYARIRSYFSGDSAMASPRRENAALHFRRVRVARSRSAGEARLVSMKPILYVKTGCPYCKAAMDYLDRNKIGYEKIDVRGSDEGMKRLQEISGQTKTPTLVWNSDVLANFGVEQLEDFLRKHAQV